MVPNYFHILLNSIATICFKNVCLYIHEGYQCVVFIFCTVFIWFWSLEFSFLFYFLEETVKLVLILF